MAQSLLSSLKNEIVRLTRKVVKTDTATLYSNSATHRRHIAELRRRLDALEREVKQLRRASGTASSARSAKAESGTQPAFRFQARGLASHRAALGLSAADYGRLVGVSGATIYNWETDKSRPRVAQLPGIAEIRGLGKRQVQARLEQMSK